MDGLINFVKGSKEKLGYLKIITGIHLSQELYHIENNRVLAVKIYRFRAMNPALSRFYIDVHY
jgi:hypothetical protein